MGVLPPGLRLVGLAVAGGQQQAPVQRSRQ